MKDLLSKLEPKVLAAAGLALLLLAGVWFGLWQPAQTRQQRALQELTAADEQLRSAQLLVQQMLDLQLESTGDIAVALAAMEATFPDTYDDLQVAQTVSTLVSQSGLRLLELTLLEEESIDENITAVPYRISIAGPPSDLQGFLQGLPERLGAPSTWRNITLESSSSAGLGESGEARLGATIDLWRFSGARSVAAADEAEETGDDIPAPAPEGTDGGEDAGDGAGLEAGGEDGGDGAGLEAGGTDAAEDGPDAGDGEEAPAQP